MSDARSQLLEAIEAAVTAALDQQLPSLVDDLAGQVAERAAGLLAERVAELLGERQPSPAPAMLTVAEVAQRYATSRDWVYENSARLGAVRLGEGRAARLRFDPAKVEQALAGADQEPEPEPRRRPRKRRGRGAALLPIAGEQS